MCFFFILNYSERLFVPFFGELLFIIYLIIFNMRIDQNETESGVM